jgi:hypothetical protein
MILLYFSLQLKILCCFQRSYIVLANIKRVANYLEQSGIFILK